jgi:hypothetical protein
MTHADDHRERDVLSRQNERPQHIAIEESDIDQILADSFPASDAPPWTLGVNAKSRFGFSDYHERKD